MKGIEVLVAHSKNCSCNSVRKNFRRETFLLVIQMIYLKKEKRFCSALFMSGINVL
jgi:hypothetical protein